MTIITIIRALSPLRIIQGILGLDNLAKAISMNTFGIEKLIDENDTLQSDKLDQDDYQSEKRELESEIEALGTKIDDEMSDLNLKIEEGYEELESNAEEEGKKLTELLKIHPGVDGKPAHSKGA